MDYFFIRGVKTVGDCLKRSFEAGFRWCGIDDQVQNIQMSGEAEELATRYGLHYIDSGAMKGDNNPVLVIYADNYTETDAMYHAVFASDGAPFARWSVYAIIVGWRELRDKATKSPSGVRVGQEPKAMRREKQFSPRWSYRLDYAVKMSEERGGLWRIAKRFIEWIVFG